ncbi:hypothetical protein ElyMa_003233600 [Elysia marginata]|uniref:ABC transmembrane type-1 domain-containing protein n=1 Tax=Elysia marginata TaxID=1093978 RepID=A0AAV4J353_9GAST|nr:hypothetical protein ElyMa_003233600 [Elysia marginata]
MSCQHSKLVWSLRWPVTWQLLLDRDYDKRNLLTLTLAATRIIHDVSTYFKAFHALVVTVVVIVVVVVVVVVVVIVIVVVVVVVVVVVLVVVVVVVVEVVV